MTLQRLKEVAPHLFRTESDIRKRLSSGDSSQGGKALSGLRSVAVSCTNHLNAAFSEVGSPLRKPSLAGSPDGESYVEILPIVFSFPRLRIGSMAPLNEYQLDDDANPMRYVRSSGASRRAFCFTVVPYM